MDEQLKGEAAYSKGARFDGRSSHCQSTPHCRKEDSKHRAANRRPETPAPAELCRKSFLLKYLHAQKYPTRTASAMLSRLRLEVPPIIEVNDGAKGWPSRFSSSNDRT
jgi:hypothetical protein